MHALLEGNRPFIAHRDASNVRILSRAFMGLPCPKKAAGINWDMSFLSALFSQSRSRLRHVPSRRSPIRKKRITPRTVQCMKFVVSTDRVSSQCCWTLRSVPRESRGLKQKQLRDEQLDYRRRLQKTSAVNILEVAEWSLVNQPFGD